MDYVKNNFSGNITHPALISLLCIKGGGGRVGGGGGGGGGVLHLVKCRRNSQKLLLSLSLESSKLQ